MGGQGETDEFRVGALDGVMEDPGGAENFKRLFGETSDKKPLRLVDSNVVGDGVVILFYEPAGEDAKGSDSD